MKFFKFILFSFISTSAIAADEPRKIDFTQVVKDLNGNEGVDCAEIKPDGSGCARIVPMTIGRIAAGALDRADKNIAVPDKIIRAGLAYKIINANNAVLTSDEITMIKTAVGKLEISNAFIFQVIKAIDPVSVK